MKTKIIMKIKIIFYQSYSRENIFLTFLVFAHYLLNSRFVILYIATIKKSFTWNSVFVQRPKLFLNSHIIEFLLPFLLFSRQEAILLLYSGEFMTHCRSWEPRGRWRSAYVVRSFPTTSNLWPYIYWIKSCIAWTTTPVCRSSSVFSSFF